MTPKQNVVLFESDVCSALHILASPDGTSTKDKVLYIDFLHRNIHAILSNNLVNVSPTLIGWGIEEQGLSYLQLTGVLSKLYLRFTKELVDEEMKAKG